GPLPKNLTYLTSGLGSKARYLMTVWKAARRRPLYDFLLCGHINLLPAAFMARAIRRRPLVLVIHGKEAWQPTACGLTNYLARRIDAFISVSEFTKQRFRQWTGLPTENGFILPNAIDLTQFGSGLKNPELMRRYQLEGRPVIMTLGRL